jgi:hypothetical protein
MICINTIVQINKGEFKMKRIMVVMILSIFVSTSCSGTNQYLNHKNVLGTAGGIGGGVLGNKLCRGCNNTTKLIATIGGVFGGMLLGSRAGEFLDSRDVERQRNLIQDVLNNNPDNLTSTTQYQKTWRNKNGQQQTGMITQSATPLNTNQPNRNVYLQNDIQPLPRRNNGAGNSLYSSNNSLCRNLEVSVSISADGAPPSTRQWYKMCKEETGWRVVD